MKIYKQDNDYTIYQGDSFEVLDTLEEKSIDAIVTDPPYGLTSITKRFGKEDSTPAKKGKDGSFARLSKGFMGKTWDGTGIEYNVEFWKKCFKVLKPGGYLLSFGGTRTFHRIACAIEDAGFEIRDTLMWLYGCYSSDTQVLTDKGWKYFYELDKTEKILQWDKDTNLLSWYQPKEYFEYNIDDDMVHLKNRNTDQLITKNHSVYAKVTMRRKPKERAFNRYEACELKKSWNIDLPLAGQLINGLKVDNAYIIGWWLTDAYKHKDCNACMFSQSKPRTLNKLKDWLNLHNIKYSEYVKKAKKENHKDEHIIYVNNELSLWLRQNFPNRELTMNVLQWDYNSRLNLLEGLMDGDGSIRENSYCEVFYSKNKERLDIFQALVVSLNIKSHIDYKKGCAYFNIKKNTTQLQNKHKLDNVHYVGKVYCLKTETGAFVVRRNGKAFISGNSGFPKSHNIGLAIDKKNGVESIVISEIKTHDFSKHNGSMMSFTTTKEEKTSTSNITIKQAQNEYAGYGTCLKPAYEPIIMARKPIENTVADNMLKYGVGGINIDECRVGNETVSIHNAPAGTFAGGERERGSDTNSYRESQGRFPANVILTYDENDFDEVCGGFPNTNPSKQVLGGANRKSQTQEGTISPCGWKETNRVKKTEGYNDNGGSACRYFYCAKASKKDRDEGLEEFTLSKTTDGCIRNNQETVREFGANSSLRRNSHPTVKPTELMQYLVRLVAPKGAIVLDPFCGSGSTGKACMYENTERNANYKFIGIEMTEEYLPIIVARIDYAKNKKDFEKIKEEKAKGYEQIKLF